MRQCYSCGHQLDEKMEVFRTTLCPNCGKDLKVCLNCKFYSPGGQWDCRETIDEQVKDKDRANFCSFFSFKTGGSGKSEAESRHDKAKKEFNSLFGDE
jgi:predicted RNA-binding Zn-ribbon protein involved in translation (DUF1610 family)